MSTATADTQLHTLYSMLAITDQYLINTWSADCSWELLCLSCFNPQHANVSFTLAFLDSGRVVSISFKLTLQSTLKLQLGYHGNDAAAADDDEDEVFLLF